MWECGVVQHRVFVSKGLCVCACSCVYVLSVTGVWISRHIRISAWLPSAIGIKDCYITVCDLTVCIAPT